ncbi:MAG: glycosyltransferase family 39 protein [Deltaproteobacteria bacterium]|nr:glycosyltransferase family 39 protein [Deltaproteobacteria bacterium]
MSWSDRRLLLAAVIAWLAVAVLAIILGPPFGHDESAFAISARGDGPAWVYRSYGVRLVALPGVALGGAEWQLRLISAILGTGVVLAVFALGRAAFSPRTGAWGAAVVAGAHPLALRSSELIGDLPATACILAGLAVLVGELGRETGPRWRLLAAAPAFAAAFYLRYGSAPLIAITAGTAALIWWRAILLQPLRVLATAALFSALMAPHFLQSLHETGSLLGILDVSSRMPRRAYAGEGLVTYITSNPFQFYGALVAPLMICGLVGLVRLPGEWRPRVFLGIVAIGQLVALGMQTHAQPRYVFCATLILVLLGIDALERFGPVRLRPLALPLVIAAWLGVVVAVPFYTRFLSDARRPIAAAADAIRTDAAGRPCLVVAKAVTQLMWYSGCREHLLRDFDRVPAWTAHPVDYVVSSRRIAVQIGALLEAVPGTATALPVASENAEVWRVAPASPTR